MRKRLEWIAFAVLAATAFTLLGIVGFFRPESTKSAFSKAVVRMLRKAISILENRDLRKKLKYD